MVAPSATKTSSHCKAAAYAAAKSPPSVAVGIACRTVLEGAGLRVQAKDVEVEFIECAYGAPQIGSGGGPLDQDNPESCQRCTGHRRSGEQPNI